MALRVDRPLLALVAALAWAAGLPAVAGKLNGFDLDGAAVPAREIERGGPPRGGIPALDLPPATSRSTTPFPDDALVIGVTLGGDARAYPIPMLARHELVNDRLGGRSILVSYCPLCGTGIVFDRVIEGRALRFGVSGLLWRSDVLMYDRETESLWSQIDARAISGSRKGHELVIVPSKMTRLSAWASEHPRTTVMSPGEAGLRPYRRMPYPGYEKSRQVWFRAPHSKEFHPKTITLGLRAGSEARAYPAPEVEAAGGVVTERFAGAEVTVRWEPENRGFSVDKPDSIDAIQGYWFAWSAFHPETSVFRAPAAPR